MSPTAAARLAFVALLAPGARADEATPQLGSWRAWLATPGGELPFALEFARGRASEPASSGTNSTTSTSSTDAAWRATIGNGREAIAVDEVAIDAATATVTLDFPHYDSRITATLRDAGTRLDGTYRRRRNATEWVELPFHATAGAAKRFSDALLQAPPPGTDREPLARELAAAAARASGRFAVQFSASDDPAVALFEVAPDGSASGTFLTTTGDYRFLAGSLDRAWPGDDGLVGCCDDGLPHHFLRLSCFDGAHAFLFEAELLEDGSLAGSFWSGDRWHETWKARRDSTAALPDGFTLSRASGAAQLHELPLRDLDGKVRHLGEAAFAGRAQLVVLFGSWCPNCHDACAELKALQREFAPRGLALVGLAFEQTGDFARDAEQVRRYAKRHAIDWPLLLAGSADKAAATATLGVLDRVRAYPTFLFVAADGTLRAVHTGFNGPATGAAHAAQHAAFVRTLEPLLAGG
ncbi:MAG: TlpA family protein disulfide reductase [Planctomycetes bacterium]|nr:TlpA family protein disulfide reductase [Planctomycetota bacterium]